MTINNFVQAIISNSAVYVLMSDEDEFAQVISEETEQANGDPCMVQLLFSNEAACKTLTNLQFTKYTITPLPVSEIMEYLIAIDESGGLVMLDPTADMSSPEYEPIELYNAIGEKL